MFRKGSKHEYRITFVSASGLPDGETISVHWKRGSKGENSGDSLHKPAIGGRVSWHETVTLMCTLFPSGVPGCFDPKMIIFTVQKWRNDKASALGKTSLDIAEFATAGGAQQTRALTVKTKKGPITLVVAVASTLIAAEVMDIQSKMDEKDKEDVDDLGEQDPFADQPVEAAGAASDPPSASSPAPGGSDTPTGSKKEKEKDKKKKKKGGYDPAGEQHQDVQLLHKVLETALDGEFVPPGMPKTALVIMTHLGPLEHVEASSVTSTISALGIARKAHAWSFPAVMHWLSTAWWLVREVTPKLPPFAPVKEPQYVRPPPGGSSSSPDKELMNALHQFLYDYFMIALERAFRDLRAIVPTVPETVKHRAHRSGTTRASVLSVLMDARDAMADARVADPVRLQYFSQIARYINTTLMNLLMSSAQYCTCKAGMQIRLELSQIEEFVGSDAQLQPVKQKLEQIREAANLLVMNKRILLDESITKATFPHLSWSQIHKLISSFKPDECDITSFEIPEH
eukprot:m51a1_g762 hypothetical protein (513) ;mRNA; r:556736-558782